MSKLTNEEFVEKHLKSIQSMRESLGLPKLIIKRRDCLRCGESFLSETQANRMCYTCRPAETELRGGYK